MNVWLEVEMLRRTCVPNRVGLFVLMLAGCGSNQPTPARPTASESANAPPSSTHGDFVLPLAENVLDMVDAPTVSLTGRRLTVDGVAAGDVSAVQEENRKQRIDELWNILDAKRKRWKDAHPNTAFPGVALFRFAPNEKAIVVKSVFQTAASAGYPYGGIVVRPLRSHAHSEAARLVVDAEVPLDVPASAKTERVLHIWIEPTLFHLDWMRGDAVVSRVELRRADSRPRSGEANVLRFPELSSQIGRGWKEYGRHQQPDDRRFDQAVVYIPDDADHEVLVAVLDAVYGPRRAFLVDGKSEAVPAFNATLSMLPAPLAGAPPAHL
jgi:hypothetical protein